MIKQQQLFWTLALLVELTATFMPSVFAQQDRSYAAAKAQNYPLTPDDVTRKSITIWSDGTRMAGDVYMPKDIKPDAKLPAIVFVHGTSGVKKMAWSIRLATAFAQNGYVFLNFDYRGWGESESKLMMLEDMPNPGKDNEVTVKARAIRWQMDFGDQVTDIRNAIAFISGEPNVDYTRIGVFGTSYGGGLATWIAAKDPRVKCAVAQVPGMGGGRSKGYYRYAYGLMSKQARGDTEPIPFKTGAPGGKMSSYSHMRYNSAKNVVYDVFQAVEQMKAPLLIVDAGKEELMDIKQNGGRVATILKSKGATVKYHIVKEMSHYDVYGKQQAQVLKMELDWFDQHLKP